jgi:hypothetical protein
MSLAAWAITSVVLIGLCGSLIWYGLQKLVALLSKP